MRITLIKNHSTGKTIGLFLVVLFCLLATLIQPKFTASASDNAKWPADPGSQIKTSGKLRADLSNAQEGYFLASITSPSNHKMLDMRHSSKNCIVYAQNWKQ